jgi:hypothetical protein
MNSPEPVSRGGHERRDADVVSLFLVAGLLVICGALVISSCLGLLHFFHTKDRARSMHTATTTQHGAECPEPRLIVTPAADLEKFRAREDEELKSYTWIDRKSGIVRIPIDRAMELIVQRGLPPAGANKTPLQLMQERPQQGETPAPTPHASQ